MNRKKSWREIDQGRSTTTPSNQGRFRIHTPGGASSNPKATSGYKSDLNKLFDKGEVPESLKSIVSGISSQSGDAAERQQLLRQARQAETQAEFNVICNQILEKYELPDDQNLLTRMLDHPEESIVQKALEQLVELDGRRPLMKRALLRTRLVTVEQVARDQKTHDLLAFLKERL